MAFSNRKKDKPLSHYASLSIRDQAMVKALSAAIAQEVGEELRAILDERFPATTPPAPPAP